MLAQSAYRSRPVLVERNCARVFYMAVATGGGLLLRGKVEVPMVVAHASMLHLVPEQMWLNPRNLMCSMCLGEDMLPQIPMVET